MLILQSNVILVQERISLIKFGINTVISFFWINSLNQHLKA